MKTLTRYWFVLERQVVPSPLNLGCGVTAYDRNDAIELLRSRALSGKAIPRVIDVIENVDVSGLDQKHVVPNMGSVTERGIWFPLGL